jgi:AbrB family looped-hinge helix DNA binding protein
MGMFRGEGKHTFGTVKVGEKGQIVIPKEAREMFGIKPGDLLMIIGDEKRGLTIMKADDVRELVNKILEKMDKAEED